MEETAQECAENAKRKVQDEMIHLMRGSEVGRSLEDMVNSGRAEVERVMDDIYAWADDNGAHLNFPELDKDILKNSCDNLHSINSKQWELNQGSEKTIGAFFNATLEIRGGLSEAYAGGRGSGVVALLNNKVVVLKAEAHVHSRTKEVSSADSCSNEWKTDLENFNKDKAAKDIGSVPPKKDIQHVKAEGDLKTTGIAYFNVLGQDLYSKSFDTSSTIDGLPKVGGGLPVSIPKFDFLGGDKGKNPLKHSIRPEPYETYFPVGPFIARAQVGFSGSVGIDFGISAQGMSVVADVTPVMEAGGYVHVGLYFYVGGVDAYGNLTILDLRVPLAASAGVKIGPNMRPVVEINLSGRTKMIALKGDIGMIAWLKVPTLKGFDTKKWTYQLYNWDGIVLADRVLFNYGIVQSPSGHTVTGDIPPTAIDLEDIEQNIKVSNTIDNLVQGIQTRDDETYLMAAQRCAVLNQIATQFGSLLDDVDPDAAAKVEVESAYRDLSTDTCKTQKGHLE